MLDGLACDMKFSREAASRKLNIIEKLSKQFHPARHTFLPLFELKSCPALHDTLTQTPYDRFLWPLVSLNGKADLTELRKRTKLKAAELNPALNKLAKDGRILIVPKERLGQTGP